jgi:D-glycero-alpha-D-manno-heptose-7-phosphate kinase
MKIYARAPVRIDFGGGTTDIHPVSKKIGGAVLNAAINHHVNGSLIKLPNKTALEYHSTLPTSSGLGTSGAMNVVWLALTTRFKDRKDLAEWSYKIENATMVVGGKQDQYAAVLGGINFLKFDKTNAVKIEKLKLPKAFLKKFEDRLFLDYIGPRFSSDINQVIVNNFVKGNRKTVESFKKIKKNTKDMRDALVSKDLDHFSCLLNNEWDLRKSLHPRVTTKEVDARIKFAMDNGATGAKVCGAGGGGSILFYAENAKKVMKKIKNQIIPIKFDHDGLKTWKK